MLRMILQAAKSDLPSMLMTPLSCFDINTRGAPAVSSPEIVELHRLLLRISGADARNGLDAQGLADIEHGILNSGQPGLMWLYRRLLADVDIETANADKGVSILRFPTVSRVRGRVRASVANCVTFSHRITSARRNDHDRGGSQPSQTDYLR